MAGWLTRTVLGRVADRGFVVQRHPAVRRQALLAAHGVDVVFDIGAAVGLYGRELRHFGYRGAIVSFEPLRAPYERLRAEADGDPLWSTHHKALGDEPATATMNIATNSDSSSLLPMTEHHLAAAPHVTYDGSESVEVGRLDDVAPQHLTPSSRPFLKVDTQGFDQRVFRGGEQTMAQVVGFQLELSMVPLYEGGMLVDEAVGWAYDQGFVLMGLETGFTGNDHRLLQADGVFFRAGTDGS